MTEPVRWEPDGTPRSTLFDDVYRPATGGLAQARAVFMGGCKVLSEWAGVPRYCILETGFGLGLNFLAAWQAWRDDPQRPGMLHFASVEAWPVTADDILRSARHYPELEALGLELAQAWWGLLPGVHRLTFDGGRVLLTLAIGDGPRMLRQLDFCADAVFLDGFNPAVNPDMWSAGTLKSVVRLCRRGTRIATWTASGEVRRTLAQCGFKVSRVDGLPPKRHRTEGSYDPPWQPRGERHARLRAPGRCAVVGAGLAGAAVAASLARRGWQVQVLDAADAPASGASALPAGLLVTPVSPDDNLLCRLARAGARITMSEADRWLRRGQDFDICGVLERCPEAGRTGIPDSAMGNPWARAGKPAQHASAGFGPSSESLWHERAGWVKPGALAAAWLAQPGVSFSAGAVVDRVEPLEQGWRLRAADGSMLAEADLVVLCAAHATTALLPGPMLPLTPIRGQVSWGWREDGASYAGPAINGSGHLLPAVPFEHGGRAGTAWFIGATYGRDDAATDLREADQQANLERLAGLSPAAASWVGHPQARAGWQAWAGIRCASRDRRPLVGEVASGLWVSTAMGSRGLTFAGLCAELIAARLHDEPAPVETRLGEALSVDRLRA